MSLISTRIVKLDLSEIVFELRRLNNNLEQVFQINKPQLQPEVDFDADDYSSVLYSDEEEELVEQHLSNIVAGVTIKG